MWERLAFKVQTKRGRREALGDADKIARVAKTGFYLAAELANTPTRPQWNPDSYKEIVEQ